MKRIIYSCFLLTLLFLSKNIIAQPFNATLTPNAQCYSPGTNTAVGVVTATQTGATSYTWLVSSPPPSSCTVGQTVAVAGGTAVSFFFPCCGIYTITCYPYNAGLPLVGTQNVIFYNVECPTQGTVTSSANPGAGNSATVCSGIQSTLSALGGATWTWTPGGGTGANIAVSPTASTCYTANGNTAVGCTLQATYCLNVQTLNVNISPPSQTICAGTTVTLTANTAAAPLSNVTYQWYQGPPGGAPVGPSIGSNSTQVVSPITNTGYTLNAFVSTCSVSVMDSINVALNSSMQASAPSLSVCGTESYVLTATSSATSFTWTQLAGPGTATFNASGQTTLNPTSAIGPGTFAVSGSNTACASTTATVSVGLTIFTPTVTSSSPAVCPGETFTLTGSGGAANSYTWGTISPLPPTVICAGCAAVQTPTLNTATTYDVGATSPGGCQNATTISIGVTPNTSATLAASAASVCACSSVTLTASGGNLYTFVSSLSGTIGPSSTTVSVIVDNPCSNATYTVYATGPSGFCLSTATVNVNMITGGSLTLTTTQSAATICASPPGTSTLTASGATNYTWTGIPAGVITNSTAATTNVSPTVTTIYTVTGSNGGGCVGIATLTVFVSPTPTITILNSAAYICAGYTSTLVASGAASYTWTGSNFSIPVNQPSISVSPGTQAAPCATFSVRGGSPGANCPSPLVTTSVCLSPPLVITTSISPIQATTCIETNYNPGKLSKPLNMYAFGAANYVWFPYNPAFMTYSLGPTTTVRPPTSTCYTVTGSTSVCSGTALICVNVIPQFTMNVVPPLPAICLGDSIILSIINIQQPLAVGPASLFTYYWNDPPNSPPPSITAQNTPTVLAFPQSTSTYSIEVFDSRMCASLPRLVTVTVLPRPLTAISLPIINNVPTNTVCFVGDRPGAPDNQLDLVASNVNVGLPPGVSPTYTWTGPNNPPAIVTPSNNFQVTVTAPHRTPYVETFTLETGYNGIQGCKRIDTISVRVIDCRPVTTGSITFITDVNTDDTLCVQNCITFQATTDTLAGGPQTYTWTFKGGLPLYSNDHTPTVCYDLPGQYDVVLQVANPYPIYESPPGSVAYTAFYKRIKVVDYPNVTIIPPGRHKSDTTIKFSQSIVLTATNAATYTWSPHYNISSTNGSVVTINPTKTTQYIVTGFSSKACFSSDTLNVIVIDDCGDMFVPNAFSPNGDDVNDVLIVRGVCLQTLTFMIFNRWGEKVFETNDINVGWDGTYHGEKMNTGVFVYRLEGKTYDGKGFSSKGNITLMR